MVWRAPQGLLRLGKAKGGELACSCVMRSWTLASCNVRRKRSGSMPIGTVRIGIPPPPLGEKRSTRDVVYRVNNVREEGTPGVDSLPGYMRRP